MSANKRNTGRAGQRELDASSIAGIVLPPPQRRAASAACQRRELPAGSPAALVLGSQRRSARPWLAALSTAAALHLGAGTALVVGHTSAPAVAPAPEQRTVRIDHVVDLAPPPAELPPPAPAEPPPPPAEAPPPPAAAPPARAPARAQAQAAARAPAQAGKVLAQEPSAEAPLDFTGFDIATGEGVQFAGGVTASSGTSEQAVHGAGVAAGGSASAAAADTGADVSSRARPVSLRARDWSCPWPRAADVLSIDEQVVLLRLVVRADGSVASATTLSDPGYGFAEAALQCARSHRFQPATDAAGEPVLSTSPPIRVTFVR
ncbi:energy transducer TonB [Haliangium ochraceum]|uniref:TonB C-terminal domain-containing protein n=1 Tax=Haliangium ochraceum (strain DSM 14365 / JCM 11303 / SMP-2) TaxID=502025 RepID=D0LFW6_HALO1|nr:energy transducer TonB [Haliangium ochraceum]ACY14568.1 conserved hypothetical protein [Haliangium ochraceum DSM 14365]